MAETPFYIQVGTSYTITQEIRDTSSGDTIIIKILRLSDNYTWDFTNEEFNSSTNTGTMTFIEGDTWKATFTPSTADTYLIFITPTSGYQVTLRQTLISIGSPAPSGFAGTTLVSPTEFESIMQVTISDSTYKNQLLYISSAFIERYCKRTFSSSTYTSEKYNGNGTHFLQLEKYPVTTLTSVILWDTFNNSALTTYTQYTDYLLHDDGSTGMIWLRQGFVLGINNYRITYTAGYTNIPYDLKYATCLLAYHVYKNSGKVGMDSERIGNYSYKMSAQGKNSIEGKNSIGGLSVPSEILSMIEMYVKKEIV
jgi:hypothetical protein